MEISVRSYLTAGMAAVVGATAISLAPLQPAPALQAAGLPTSAVVEIALTGTSIPWNTIVTLVKTLSSGGSLSGAVGSLLGSVGSEVAKEILPVVTAAAGDVVKYVGTALAALLTGPGAPGIDFTAILATVSAAITSGNISGALGALTSGLSAPLTQISKVLFTPEFQAFVTGKVGTVLGALPEILRTAVQKIVGLDIKPLIDALSGLLGGILPGASVVAAPRALSAAAAPVAVGLTAIKPAAAVDVPAVSVAPEVEAALAAPTDDSPAKAPAEAPSTTPAAEAVAAVEATPAEEVAPPVVAVETVAPVTSASSTAAPEATDAGPAAVTRLAKPSPRGNAAPKAAASHAAAGAGRG